MATFINKPMLEYMHKITERAGTLRQKNSDDFTPNIMLYFNKRAKNGNYYGYDKYGIIIRKDAGASPKSPFGWIRNEQDELVSVHLKKDCPEEIKKKETIIYIQSKFQSQWNNKNNILRKIYDRYENGCEEDDRRILEKQQ